MAISPESARPPLPTLLALLAPPAMPSGHATGSQPSRSACIEVRSVLDGSDDRILVIAGPCSVHDSVAALDYAGRLAASALGAISRRGTA